jgi:hypothetical protein
MKLVKQLEKLEVIFLDTAPVIYFVEQNPKGAFLYVNSLQSHFEL